MNKNFRKLISVFVCISVILLCFQLVSCSKTEHFTRMVDNDGNEIAKITNAEPFTAELENDAYSAYVQIAFDDAVKIIMDNRSCSETKAQKLLFKETTIQTAFDKSAFDACDKAYKQIHLGSNEFAFALTDLNGNLICAYSADEENNYAMKKTQPYSSIKPLSVYSPAIENNIVNCSTVFIDAPVKKVRNEDGVYVDWPTNPQNRYSNSEVSIADGIKHSYNTTAINCLLELGVRNSVEFLTDKFNIDLSQEIKIMNSYGEEEILSDIGLGYFKAGVSPVDMAGYYQIFANNGKYIEPNSVLAINDNDGNLLFERETKEKKIISSDTAFIMNFLLQKTLSFGGTAEKARVDGVQIGGKTGTGDSSKDNWFVGFSPEYSFAVWHGRTSKSFNQCAMIFNSIAQNLNFDKTKSFDLVQGVQKCVYCKQTGKLLGNSCVKLDTGYFKENSLPEICDGNHNLN